MRIGFIGLGNMASAMICGMRREGLAEGEDILGSAKTQATRDRARKEWGIRTTEDNREVVLDSDVIILAVKPQFFEEVIAQIRGINWEGKTLVSLAPGKTVRWIQEQFGFPIPVVRCMPNTPALVGEGCSGVCASEEVTEDFRSYVNLMLSSFGRVVEVGEHFMDAVVGVSGSSPAYVFLFIEAMADGAVACGLPRKTAYEMAAQAVLGSAKMVLETGKHPGELKDMVCSPGGTTIQAVKVLEEKNFRGTVMAALTACVEKSKNM